MQSAQGDARIAVASNFQPAARQLEQAFEDDGAETVSLVFGSTGKHFAQIINGAPFDAFLAADSERPFQLESMGRTHGPPRFTYASGRLVLWSANHSLAGPGEEILYDYPYRRLAIANPRLAPYGRAAMQTLEALGLERALAPRLLTAENINQAFHFTYTGNAEMGLVALSQIITLESSAYWLVPEQLHEPIDQQAVLLSDSTSAAAFLAFIRSPPGRHIIVKLGYTVPNDQ